MKPFLYRNPVPVSPEAHGSAGLTAEDDFSFARGVNAIPLTLAEFPLAASHYPIVFIGDPEPAPFIVAGLRDDENLMLDAQGRWRPGFYVPAYVRRYPFILALAPDPAGMGGGSAALWVDDTPGALIQGGGRPLFENGQPGAVLRQAGDACRAFHQAWERTRLFSAALAERGLLAERQANARLSRGGRFTLRGFRIIDETVFRALDDSAILDWRRRNWLGPVYLQLQSTLNWPRLIDLLAERTQTEPD